jgi:hypothetical protein
MLILSRLLFFISLLFSNGPGDSPHGPDFKISCKTCHSSKGWQLDKEIYSFNHNTTKLPLVGQHVMVSCRQCHITLVFSEAKTTCNQCHSDIHQATVGLDCSKCHTPVSWLVNNINEIHQVSRFPLLGAHRTADCSLCHKSESLLRFDVSGVNCISCHRDKYMAATNPNHAQSGISEDCSLCHSISSFQWGGAGFNHSTFPLVQGHSAVKCSDCHKTAGFTDAKTDCYSCHQQDFAATQNPGHSISKFSTNCKDCHSLVSGWKPVTFNHNAFPLTSGHSKPACIDCHVGGNYTSTRTDCYSCHQQNYVSTANPNHISSGFSQLCQNCHSTNPGWKPAVFNHSAFPLTLGHSTPACIDCHKGGNYTTTPTVCYSCHQQDFAATANPNHASSGFSQLCQSCHSMNPGWKPTTFNHNIFPLTLGHSTPACIDCHKGGNYTTTPTDCYGCHQPDFTSTTNPNHVSAGIPTTCSICHTLKPGWTPTTYSHTTFPLTLGHATPTCADCHKGNYTTTSPNCYSCHQQDYSSTTNPNHIVAGIPTTCSTCHSVNPGWTPATFSHTSFPLTLGHATPACADCHKGNYTTTSVDCYSCHQTDYNNSTNPNHKTLAFSTTCTSCHTTKPGWTPATYTQHDSQFFPIYSGRHNGQWSLCSNCHTNTANFTVFDCIRCHTSVHRGSNYTSARCYSCHPRGTVG